MFLNSYASYKYTRVVLMRPLYEMKLIQIEITNACVLRCANCTRFVGHHRKPFFMYVETFTNALDSLEGFPGHIGIMGGEPTLHPQLPEILRMMREKIPEKNRREFWTTGLHKWEQYKPILSETFDKERIAYNDHSQPDGVHQPLLVAAEDVIKDKKLMWELIDNCWVQMRWSASITPKGAFFCEVAAAADHLFDGPGGYPVEKGWWKKTPKEFADQVQRYCPKCSAAIPIPSYSDKAKHDLVSKSNFERLKRVMSPKYFAGNATLYDKEITVKDLENEKLATKQNYRTFVAHGPEDYPEYLRRKKANSGSTAAATAPSGA